MSRGAGIEGKGRVGALRGVAGAVALLLAGASVCPAQVAAQEPAATPPSRLTILAPAAAGGLDPAVEAISRKLDADLGYLLSSPFRVTPKGAATAALALLATCALLEKDAEWSRRVGERGGVAREKAWDRVGDLGSHVPETALALYLAGYLFDSPGLKSGALQGGEAVALTALMTVVSAPIIGHAGPGQAGDPDTFRGLDRYHSMPDMGTALTFALAGTLAWDQGFWADLGACTVAAGVGLARVHNREAWPSDAFAGAVLGAVIGRTVASLSTPGEDVAFGPALLNGIGGPVAGVGFTLRY
jgi:hypothetical protein